MRHPCNVTLYADLRTGTGLKLAMMLRIWAFLDWCFFGPASTGAGLPALLIRTLSYPYAVIRDLWRGEINLRAMGLVYTTLLSLIPLLAFSFAILKVFGAHRELQPIVYEFFRPVGEQAATQLTGRVMQFADRVSSGIVGSVGFALLAWTLLGTIKKVEDSFNFLWRVDQPRSFARRIVEYLTLLIVGPLSAGGFYRSVECDHRQCTPAGSGQDAVYAAAAGYADRSRSVRDGHGILHRHVHVCAEHPGAMAAGPHWCPGRGCFVGRGRQDVHRLRGLFNPA